MKVITIDEKQIYLTANEILQLASILGKVEGCNFADDLYNMILDEIDIPNIYETMYRRLYSGSIKKD